tara:strand:- start:494 stop:1201 length:708 start_codon:yes stop_codon:yes gene_type:complete
MNKNNISVSIIIPCFNEVKTIKKVINNILEMKFENLEIIVVDDGSTDGSHELLNEISKEENIILLSHKKNFGKGFAIRTALEKINNEIVIIQDADLEYNPKDYPALLLPFKETNADIVYGSRFLGSQKYTRIHFFWHFLANKLLTFICNLLTNLNMSDMETGYKLFKKDVIKSIKIEEKSFGVEPEITLKLAKKNYKFFEVPISYNGRSYEEGKKIGLKDAFIALFCILKYKLKK